MSSSNVFGQSCTMLKKKPDMALKPNKYASNEISGISSVL